MLHSITIRLDDLGDNSRCIYEIAVRLNSELHPVELAKKAAMGAVQVLEREDVVSFELTKTAHHEGE